MKITQVSFPIEIGSVADIDFFPDGTTVSIQGTQNHQVLLCGDVRIDLPAAWNPPFYSFVRVLSNSHILVANGNHHEIGSANAWILNRQGDILTAFDMGSWAVEITCLLGQIAVAFHPLSAKAMGYQVHPLQRSGILFFDNKGKMITGFNQLATKNSLYVENVRCMTATSKTQLAFVPEKALWHGEEIENPVVFYDFCTHTPNVIMAPAAKAEAISTLGSVIHLSSPIGWEDQIITFDPSAKISQHRGEFLGVFRGLSGGAFLAQQSASSYLVIEPESLDLFASPVDQPAEETTLL